MWYTRQRRWCYLRRHFFLRECKYSWSNSLRKSNNSSMPIVGQVKTGYLLGESCCQNPTATLGDVRPNPFSVDGSNSPSPTLPITSLFLPNSASEGKEWTDTEVVAISESFMKLCASFRGPKLTAKDWSILGTPRGTVVAACRWFSSLTDGLRRAVGLLSSSTLPEAEMEENMLQDYCGGGG